MKFENLEKLFENFLKKIVAAYPDRYADHEKLEDDLGKLSDKFETTKFAELDGKTPAEYVKEIVNNHELFDYVDECLKNDIEVPDSVCDEVIKADGAVEYLNGLLYEKNIDANMLAVVLMCERGGDDVEDIFISLLTNDEIPDEIKTQAYDFLSEDDARVVDKILKVIHSVPEEKQGILVEVMANYKGIKDVYFWLITMLQRADDVPVYAGLLGSYGDTAAIDILKSFAVDTDINYIEYVEIRNAVEELGGEMPKLEKDFCEDPYFQYMNKVAEDDSVNNPEENQ